MSDDSSKYGGARPKVRSENVRTILDLPGSHRAPRTDITPPAVREAGQIIPKSTTRHGAQPLPPGRPRLISRHGVTGPRRHQSPSASSSGKSRPPCSPSPPPPSYRQKTGRHSRVDREQKMQEAIRAISAEDLPFEYLSLQDKPESSTTACDFNPAPPQSTKIRDCDFCRREYIAITTGISIEEERPGSPSRVCDDCKYKHPTTVEGEIVEEIPGWYLRVPSSLPKSQKTAQRPSPIVRDLLTKYPDLPSRGVHDYEELWDEEDEKAITKRLSRPLNYQSSGHLESWKSWQSHLPADLLMSRHVKKRVLPPLRECNQYNAKVLGAANSPCDVHIRGDPKCWLSWDFEDIPEQAYKRYWKQYRRPDSVPVLDQFGRFKQPAKIMKFKNIYRPKKWYAHSWDKRMTTISEKEVL